MTRYSILTKFAAAAMACMMAFSSTACDEKKQNNGGGNEEPDPVTPELPALPEPGEIHTYKAPLYWSIYEYAREMELAGIPYDQMDLSSDQWDAVIDMMATRFKPYGYDMICTDGFLPQRARDGGIYMSHYGSMPLKELVRRAKEKGLKVGVYDNPLWIKGNLNSKVPGTNYTLRSLLRNPQDKVMYPEVTDRPDFTWLVTDHPGAREYIDGWFKHYHDLGVDFVRMDFMCWYEDGDPGRDYFVTCGYGRERYERGLAYICESAAKYGIFTSIVMPEMYHDAELERKYCNMTRIVQDTNIGGWHHFSSFNRGKIYDRWPYADNQMDGFTHWSHIGGRGKIILDGDFLRLNRCTTDDERRAQVSLQLIAGGPVAIADTPETIGELDKFYTNEELLALNTDRFVGKPLSDAIDSEGSCIWWGNMSNGDVVLAMFNREETPRDMSVDLSLLGINGACDVRDLWAHQDEAPVYGSFKATVPAHGCKVVKMVDRAMPKNIFMVGPSSPGLWDLDCAPGMVNEGNGVFSYRGNLYKGELQFIDAKNWDTAIRYVPEVGGWHIVNASDATIIGEAGSDRKWYVPDYGTWDVKMYFGNGGKLERITAERVGDLSPLMVPLGAAPGQWDSAFPNPRSYIYPAAGTSDVFVWEGRLPYNERNQLKFISYPTNWWEAEFYVPASVDEGQSFKTVTLGEKYPVKKAINRNGDALDLFWSLAMEDCRPYMTYKATLNKSDMTIVFTEGEQTHVPEHLYITGSASPSLWNHNMVEMVSEGNGVYSYRGNLYMGEMRFLDRQDFGAGISYVPYYGGTHITDTSSAILQIEGEPGRNWWVPEYGEWNVIVTITEGGRKVRVSAIRLGDMTPQVYALGHATGAWDCLWPSYTSYIRPKDGAQNVFVWEGSLAPHIDGSGVEQRQHLKFIKYPKAWNEGCIFYVPTEIDADKAHARTVKVGDKLPVAEVTADNCKDGQLDWFWGFAADACTPDKVYKVTLDLNDRTIEFAEAGVSTGVSDVAASGLKVFFVGDSLVVEGASSAIAVYDIAGRLLATSAGGTLTVDGLPGGVYVVRTAETAVKIVK